MEPEFPTPRINPEHGPVQPDRNGERQEALGGSEYTTEREGSAERYEQRSEAGATASEAASISLPTPVTTDPPSTTDASTPIADDVPLVAADEDLIEKEWVDKAKHILAQTKDDPYRREEEISRLQVEYLKKRYGKELGVTNR